MTDIAEMIALAARKAEASHEAQEAKARGPKPPPLPLPTKKEAWEAYVQLASDRDEVTDPHRFEAWWRCEASV
jgi:hypothetical protein